MAGAANIGIMKIAIQGLLTSSTLLPGASRPLVSRYRHLSRRKSCAQPAIHRLLHGGLNRCRNIPRRCDKIPDKTIAAL
jgi:hypothetical protein